MQKWFFFDREISFLLLIVTNYAKSRYTADIVNVIDTSLYLFEIDFNKKVA